MTDLSRLEEHTGARERLHRISHHFLSEEATLFRLALLTDPDGLQTLQIDALARALAACGKSVTVIDPACRLISTVRPAPGSASGLIAEGIPDNGIGRVMEGMRRTEPPDITIIAAPAADAHVADCSAVLLDVPAHPAGMRNAYARLKECASLHQPRGIGITITQAADRNAAESCFNKFALAAYNFLGLRITSYSYLAVSHDQSANHREASAQMACIARLLLNDWRGTGQRRQDEAETKESIPINTTAKGQP